MTLIITGSVETFEDVEVLCTLIRDLHGAELLSMEVLYWEGYPVLVAWEDYVTGLNQKLVRGAIQPTSPKDKAGKLRRLLEEVNTILGKGFKYPVEVEG